MAAVLSFFKKKKIAMKEDDGKDGEEEEEKFFFCIVPYQTSDADNWSFGTHEGRGVGLRVPSGDSGPLR